MTTAEATLGIGSIDAAIGVLSRVAELERSVRKSAVLKGVRRVLKRVQLALLLALVNVLDVCWLLLLVGIGHRKVRRLTSYMNQAAFDGDEGLAELQGIAKCCGDLVQCLDRLYGQRRRLGPLLPLNGLVLPQLDNLICEVEDIGETAALSGSPEIRASILEQLAAHGII